MGFHPLRIGVNFVEFQIRLSTFFFIFLCISFFPEGQTVKFYECQTSVKFLFVKKSAQSGHVFDDEQKSWLVVRILDGF